MQFQEYFPRFSLVLVTPPCILKKGFRLLLTIAVSQPSFATVTSDFMWFHQVVQTKRRPVSCTRVVVWLAPFLTCGCPAFLIHKMRLIKKETEELWHGCSSAKLRLTNAFYRSNTYAFFRRRWKRNANGCCRKLPVPKCRYSVFLLCRFICLYICVVHSAVAPTSSGAPVFYFYF